MIIKTIREFLLKTRKGGFLEISFLKCNNIIVPVKSCRLIVLRIIISCNLTPILNNIISDIKKKKMEEV